MKKLIFLGLLFVTIINYSQRREVYSFTTITEDTTFMIYPTDRILMIFGIVDDTSTDSLVYSGRDSTIVNGMWMQMDSIRVAPGDDFKIGLVFYPNIFYLDSLTIHNRDGCITRFGILK